MRLALIAGLALIAIAIALTLSRAPLVLAGTNGVAPERVIATTRGGSSACQSEEVLPADTSTIRIWMAVNLGPEVKVAVLSGSHVIARGTRKPIIWTGAVVAIPVKPLRRTYSNVRICFELGPGLEEFLLIGGNSSEGGLIGVRVQGPKGKRARHRIARKAAIEFLRYANGSWWSRAVSIAKNIGVDLPTGGGWTAVIAIALMATAMLLMSALILRQLGRGLAAGAPIAGGAQTTAPPLAPEPVSHSRAPPSRRRFERVTRAAPRLRSAFGRVPTAGLVCLCIGFLSAATWSLLTPPFQVPDEPSHFAYAQQLAETHRLPTSGGGGFSPQELTILEETDHEEVRFNPAITEVFPPAQQRRIKHDLAHPRPGQGSGGAGVAASQPPLYYALETIPYYLGEGTLLERLERMRLLSALMAGLTALFAFLFLREALPRVPWVWTVGGLVTALAPLEGFMSGAVNPDSMLAAVAAATFYCLARAFRRGLTSRMAVAIGLAITAGLLTKLNFVGLLPGIALALLLLARRRARASGWTSALRSLAPAIAIPAAPAVLYALVNLLSNHPGLGLVSSAIGLTHRRGSPLHELSYIWQSFLPRLPGMANDFPGTLTTRQIWFDRSVGLYGWLDTYFPDWVYTAALVPAGLVAALCARALVSSRGALRDRAGELLAYAVIGLGVLLLIAGDSYLEFPGRAGGYSEPRYLLPLAVFFAAAFALAARGAGRRWGPAAGTLIVLLIFAHDIFSQLLLVGRYYR